MTERLPKRRVNFICGLDCMKHGGGHVEGRIFHGGCWDNGLP